MKLNHENVLWVLIALKECSIILSSTSEPFESLSFKSVAELVCLKSFGNKWGRKRLTSTEKVSRDFRLTGYSKQTKNLMDKRQETSFESCSMLSRIT